MPAEGYCMPRLVGHTTANSDGEYGCPRSSICAVLPVPFQRKQGPGRLTKPLSDSAERFALHRTRTDTRRIPRRRHHGPPCFTEQVLTPMRCRDGPPVVNVATTPLLRWAREGRRSAEPSGRLCAFQPSGTGIYPIGWICAEFLSWSASSPPQRRSSRWRREHGPMDWRSLL